MNLFKKIYTIFILIFIVFIFGYGIYELIKSLEKEDLRRNTQTIEITDLKTGEIYYKHPVNLNITNGCIQIYETAYNNFINQEYINICEYKYNPL